MAGGPKTETLLDALKQTADGMRAGARGAVVGRNIWGHSDTEIAARAFKAVIHDGLNGDAALAAVSA
jgi:class I fructose-bisphosphate aldolase